MGLTVNWIVNQPHAASSPMSKPKVPTGDAIFEDRCSCLQPGLCQHTAARKNRPAIAFDLACNGALSLFRRLIR